MGLGTVFDEEAFRLQNIKDDNRPDYQREAIERATKEACEASKKAFVDDWMRMQRIQRR